MAEPKDIDRLVALVAAARAEAERLGPGTAAIAEELARLVGEAEALQARDGRPDQGIRLGDLTTGNDQ